MKKKLIRIIILTLTLALLLPFASCAKADKELEIKVYALNGTTALGMAQMIDSASNGTDEMNYNISLYTSADAITGAIINGECAIAALPTNVAVKLFNILADIYSFNVIIPLERISSERSYLL